MLKIKIYPTELYNEQTQEFFYYPEKEVELQLEHSLLSISKWESKWHKPFLAKNEKTNEELLDYIRCMTLNTVSDLKVYQCIDRQAIEMINQYIDNPMTATTFSNLGKKKSREIITSEIIYYWMVSFSIPFECQKWHLNRLLTLIRVCSEKNAPEKKMSQKEIMERNRALNKARKAKLNTRG